MPRLIYGTAWKKNRTADLVFQALQQGFMGIDTACQPKHYHEPGVGEGVSRFLSQQSSVTRQHLFLQTKFTPLSGQDPHNVPYHRSSPLSDQVVESVGVSLRNLGTSYIDSLVLHSPLSSYSDTLTVWRAMESMVEKGSVKGLGISNCYEVATLSKLVNDAKVKPSVVQNRFYPDTQYDTKLRSFCREHDIHYQSFWSLTANPHILSSSPVSTAARSIGVTREQIFFRYLMQSGICPLTGTTNPSHMQQDLAVFDFQLPDTTVKQIDSLIGQ